MEPVLVRTNLFCRISTKVMSQVVQKIKPEKVGYFPLALPEPAVWVKYPTFSGLIF